MPDWDSNAAWDDPEAGTWLNGGAPATPHWDVAGAWDDELAVWDIERATDFVTIETPTRIYYCATVLDARDAVEVTIWRKIKLNGLLSLTRRELVPEASFEQVGERLERVSRRLGL